MNKKAIIAGHLCIDITPVMPSKNVRKISELFIPGRSGEIRDVLIDTGGSLLAISILFFVFHIIYKKRKLKDDKI